MRALLLLVMLAGCGAAEPPGRKATFLFLDGDPEVEPVQTAASLREVVVANCDEADMQGVATGCYVVADNGRNEVTIRFTDKLAFFEVSERCLSWERCKVTDDYGAESVWGN